MDQPLEGVVRQLARRYATIILYTFGRALAQIEGWIGVEIYYKFSLVFVDVLLTI